MQSDISGVEWYSASRKELCVLNRMMFEQCRLIIDFAIKQILRRGVSISKTGLILIINSLARRR